MADTQMMDPQRVDRNQALADVPEQTRAEFMRYHMAHPEIWKAFERFALQAFAAGKKHYGAKGIFERVRWETEIVHGREFKANNNYVSYFARIFAAKYPEARDFFEFREIKGLRAA